MIYLFSGNTEKRKEEIRKLSQSYGIVPTHLYDNDFHDRDFFDVVSVQTGLFGDKEMYIIHENIRAFHLKEILSVCSESENIFVFSENTVTKKITDECVASGVHIKDLGKETPREQKSFNIFSLTDAFGKKDKKELWILFQQALASSSPEEIHGVLWWGLKNIVLVKTSEENPGLNPYVYKKTLNFAKNFTHDDLKKYAVSLITMFHNRDAVSSLDIELEKFILAL